MRHLKIISSESGAADRVTTLFSRRTQNEELPQWLLGCSRKDPSRDHGEGEVVTLSESVAVNHNAIVAMLERTYSCHIGDHKVAFARLLLPTQKAAMPRA
jgi:hypothetical protein